MKRFILTVLQKSAEGVVLQKNGGRPERYPARGIKGEVSKPERYPARGIKGEVSKQCDLRDDRRQKSQYCLAYWRQVGVKPRGASTKGPTRLLATHDAERPAIHT